MKVKYTPGTPKGLVGRTYKVEIIQMVMREAKFIEHPLITDVKIKYENGKTEWISGDKLFSSIDMRQKIKKVSY